MTGVLDTSQTLYQVRLSMTDQPFEQTRWSLADLLPATAGPEFDRPLADLEAAGELEGESFVQVPQDPGRSGDRYDLG